MPVICNISEVVRDALDKGIRFAVFRDRADDAVHFFGDDGIGRAPLSDSYFFAMPWNGNPEDMVRIDDCLTVEDLQTLPERRADVDKPWPSDMPRMEYLTAVSNIVNDLKEHGGKTVLCRTITDADTHMDIPGIVSECFVRRRDATCCFMYTPVSGGWLIASPELLVDVDGKRHRVTTMALAGTRNAEAADAEWDEKNVDEHDMVTDYIVQSLADLGLDPHVSPTETLRAANVCHICNVIECDNCPDDLTGDMIAGKLSPTPAVCGTPKSRALSHISVYEPHPRKFYAGYFGMAAPAGMFKAYVTLRCAQISQTAYCIYSGSGITGASSAENEWRETEMKAEPLKTILKQGNRTIYHT